MTQLTTQKLHATHKFFLRLAISIAIWAIGCYILNYYEYFTTFSHIDNVVGMLPVAFILTAVFGITYLLWVKQKPAFIISITIYLLIISSIALFPTSLRGNWWINTSTSDAVQAAPDLSLYAPFAKDTLAVSLSQPSTLHLSDDFPSLDGATALYPVYAAFAQAIYREESFSPTDVVCTNTGNAYNAIMSGDRDIIFVAGPSQKQLTKAKEMKVDLHFTPIGLEAFVFLAGKDNPVDNITTQQVRNIYSGKTASWRTLGWSDGGQIIAFQRPEGSGSQTGLQNIMGRLPIQVPQPLPDPSLIGTNSLMKQVSVEWHGVQPALGYSYRYYATTMYANPEVKLLSIDGVNPSIQNIQNGSYPFVSDIYAVTNGAPKGNEKRLIDWILSSQGQEIIEKTGYTPRYATE